ncbi:MAG: aromatic acid decarboxylase [Planctomycetes bacterium SCN 63-9]|nr:MAG: aromatic acid decarboxylase [Planctomycetes bacterium SCN 63-9]
MSESEKARLIVGVTGATGIVYAVRALEMLRSIGIETHLVVSRAAELTREYETDLAKDDLAAMADHAYGIMDVAAPIASGSFKTLGMLIAPASMRSVAEIATGVTSTLLTRAADVVLKERRKLVLMVRETPLSLIHLRNLVTITEAGGIIFPPVPAFYTRPTTLDEVVDQTVGRALDQFGLQLETFPRWSDELRKSLIRQKRAD